MPLLTSFHQYLNPCPSCRAFVRVCGSWSGLRCGLSVQYAVKASIQACTSVSGRSEAKKLRPNQINGNKRCLPETELCAQRLDREVC